MISETIINIDAIMPYIAFLGTFIVIGITLFLLHNLGGLKIFSKHDNSVIKQFLDKYPLVVPEFYKKPKTEQLVENNQEIHELNKRIDHLEQYVNEINNNIENKLEKILKELHRG